MWMLTADMMPSCHDMTGQLLWANLKIPSILGAIKALIPNCLNLIAASTCSGRWLV